MDTTQGAWLGAALVALLTSAGLSFVASAPSGRALEEAVEDKPGVVRVWAEEATGIDDVFPWSDPPASVHVLMEADATAAEVIAVLDEYDDEIAEQDVHRVTVRLRGPKRATLVAADGAQAAESVVDDLVAAQEDAQVRRYHRLEAPGLREVEVVLADAGFAGVVAHADRYPAARGVSVTVSSGRFWLRRDVGRPALVRARERFVLAVDARHRLVGASVSGHGPLVVRVAPDDADAVRRLAAAEPGIGRIVVREVGRARLP